jgi:hypothetical protein
MDSQKELERIDRRVDGLWDTAHCSERLLGTLSSFLIVVAVFVVFQFLIHAYFAGKTSERLDRLERMHRIDEIGRRK